MEASATAAVVHAEGAALHPEPDARSRTVGWLFVATGLALFAAMGLLGLAMRLTQAEVLDISAAWFYRLMTLHGAGMLTGALLAMMGGLWFVLRPSVRLGFGRVLAAYAAILAGAVAVVIAVLVGGFATGWTFLSPLPFDSAGQWSTWATAVFLGGLALVGVGFFLYCIDLLSSITATFGGIGRSLGIPFLLGREDEAPPPQVIAATAVTTQGMLASAVGTTILLALLGRTISAGTEIDALWAKNLTFFFGHSIANLIIYLAAGMIYVLLPRYAGRPWKSTKPIVVGWLATLLLVTTAYSHHLYMDFVQPEAAQVISAAASSAAALPVAVVTIYTGLMLVWGSRYRWTLASVLIYLGFAGWAIGGTGAVLDSIIPINLRFHNTLWVPAHFHTYLMMGVIFWMFAFLAHLLERAAGRVASRATTVFAPATMLLGGYGLVGVWYVTGALGVPRRYAVHLPGTDGYSLVASLFVIVFAIGFLALLVEFATLGRDAQRRRGSAAAPAVAIADGAPDPPRTFRPPLGPLGVTVTVAVAVASTFVFLPPVEEASEAGDQFHHLAHAVQFLMGAALGMALISTPALFERLALRWSGLGLVAVIVAPAVMLLAMVPDVYDGLEAQPLLHALYHGGMVGLGLLTGMGAALLGRAPGRILFVLSVGMALMYAAGVSGS